MYPDLLAVVNGVFTQVHFWVLTTRENHSLPIMAVTSTHATMLPLTTHRCLVPEFRHPDVSRLRSGMTRCSGLVSYSSGVSQEPCVYWWEWS